MIDVAFRAGGRYRMLTWRSEQDGQHVILGRTEQAVFHAFKKVDQRFWGVGLVKDSYREIDVVAPTPNMHARYDRAVERDHRETFFHHVLFDAIYMKRERPDLDVPYVKICEACREERKAHRYECEVCDGQGGAWDLPVPEDEFWAQRRAAWLDQHGEKRGSTMGPSRAEPYRAEQGPLWRAYDDFGDHHDGLVVDRFTGSDSPSHYRAVFYFVVVQRLSAKLFDDYVKERRTREDEIKQMAAQATRTRQTRIADERYQKLLRMLRPT